MSKHEQHEYEQKQHEQTPQEEAPQSQTPDEAELTDDDLEQAAGGTVTPWSPQPW